MAGADVDDNGARQESGRRGQATKRGDVPNRSPSRTLNIWCQALRSPDNNFNTFGDGVKKRK